MRLWILRRSSLAGWWCLQETKQPARLTPQQAAAVQRPSRGVIAHR